MKNIIREKNGAESGLGLPLVCRNNITLQKVVILKTLFLFYLLIIIMKIYVC
jgi:hypothetical protein